MADFNKYSARQRMDSTSGALVGIRLIKAAPADRSVRLSGALEDVRGGTLGIQAVREERSRLLRPESLKPLDKIFDGGWGGTFDMLRGLARFVGSEKAVRAQRLLDTLLHEGAGFLTSSYEAEWLHGKTLLTRIDKEGFAEELTALTDEIVLPYITSATNALGDALGLGDEDVDHPVTASMLDALEAQITAVAAYVRILAGETDEKDPASVARFLKAVAPIDRLRAYHAARRTKTEEEEVTVVDPSREDDENPDAPVPVVGAPTG